MAAMESLAQLEEVKLAYSNLKVSINNLIECLSRLPRHDREKPTFTHESQGMKAWHEYLIISDFTRKFMFEKKDWLQALSDKHREINDRNWDNEAMKELEFNVCTPEGENQIYLKLHQIQSRLAKIDRLISYETQLNDLNVKSSKDQLRRDILSVYERAVNNPNDVLKVISLFNKSCEAIRSGSHPTLAELLTERCINFMRAACPVWGIGIPDGGFTYEEIEPLFFAVNSAFRHAEISNPITVPLSNLITPLSQDPQPRKASDNPQKPDGPADGNKYRWRGNTVELQPKIYKIIEYMEIRESASFDDFYRTY